jgi:hypothetical protein
LLAAQWCAGRGISGDVAGQWLGRMRSNAVDWLMVLAARYLPAPAPIGLEWTSLTALANCRSVVDYQTWALARSLERGDLPSVNGPFGTLEWPGRMRAWIEGAAGVSCCAWTPYRTSAYEVVVGADTVRGRIYCKGLYGDRAAEAATTRRLAAVAPESFAPTIAIDVRGDGAVWWMTAECRGRPADDPALVGAALARLQQRVSADVEASWIPMDLDCSNVLIDGADVAFIDLDDAFTGPAPLAMAGFALRSRGDRAAAYHAYEQAWSPPLAALRWRDFEISATVFQAWCGWLRVRRHVERGELVADLDDVAEKIRARVGRELAGGELYRG